MMMTTISDLPQELVGEILSRVLITCLGAVRSTCKLWNALSYKDQILCKAEPRHQFIGFIMMDYKLCSLKFSLHEIHSIGSKSIFDISIFQVNISDIFYCNGLLLCVTTKENNSSRLVVWNPYLGQTRWIQPTSEINVSRRMSAKHAFGYDKNKNHKIVRFQYNMASYEVYNIKSNSWMSFNAFPRRDIDCFRPGASVSGNTYFWTKEKILVKEKDSEYDYDFSPIFLICFDFTTERFGQQLLSVPFQSDGNDATLILSSVKEEKLAALYHQMDESVTEIWITTLIEPDAVLWIPFLKLDIKPEFDFQLSDHDSFFIDEKKKVAVIFNEQYSRDSCQIAAYIIGDNRYLEKVDLKKDLRFRRPIMCSSYYVPSLVEINQISSGRKRRQKKSKKKEKKKRKQTNKA